MRSESEIATYFFVFGEWGLQIFQLVLYTSSHVTAILIFSIGHDLAESLDHVNNA